MSIKDCFVSRYGSDGYLMEVDFSQLEVVALAILSRDPVLIDDLKSGRDMHRARAAELFCIPEMLVTDEQRQLSKQLSFQLQYGAGAASMADKNGISMELAAAFIFNYYERYIRVKEWQAEVKQEVMESRQPTDRHTPAGKPSGAGVHQSITGRVYKFYEYDNKYRREPTFSPTEIKNYPVQGFATADIMALYRGRVYRWLLNEDAGIQDDVKLINTVHDSVMLDVRGLAMVSYVSGAMESIAEELPTLLKDLWGIDCPTSLKVDCKYGPKWSEMTKLTEGY